MLKALKTKWDFFKLNVRDLLIKFSGFGAIVML
jgi:hypothetical protein